MSERLIKLTMPEPCSNKWENMFISDGGRYCNSCATVVKDFSGMSDKAISDYFTERKDQKICGRIYKSQLERITIRIPGYLAQKRISHLHKFLLILLICFGQSVFSVIITGHNSSDLYAQTTQTAKKKKKKKKHRSPSIITEIVWTETAICGNMVPLEDKQSLPAIKTASFSFGKDSILKKAMNKENPGDEPKSPPVKNQGYAEAALPFIRRRKKISSNKK